MEYQAYDTQSFGRPVSFFEDEGTGHPQASAASVPEADVVRWLFETGPAAAFVRSRFASGAALRIAFEAKGRMVEGARIGDVDVVLGHEPSRALAVECKRLTVKARYPDGVAPGKLGGLKKVDRQATALWKMGFHEAALAIIVQTEGWDREHRGAYVFRGARPHHFEAALSHPAVQSLPPEVTLVFIEVIHATRRPLGEAGVVGVGVHHRGGSQDQPMGLTDRVREAWAGARWL